MLSSGSFEAFEFVLSISSSVFVFILNYKYNWLLLLIIYFGPQRSNFSFSSFSFSGSSCLIFRIAFCLVGFSTLSDFSILIINDFFFDYIFYRAKGNSFLIYFDYILSESISDSSENKPWYLSALFFLRFDKVHEASSTQFLFTYLEGAVFIFFYQSVDLFRNV